MSTLIGKQWLKGMQTSFGSHSVQKPHSPADWVLVTPHAVADYPCREMAEWYLLKLLHNSKTEWLIETTYETNRLKFKTNDPGEFVEDSRRLIKLIIEFPNKNSILSLPVRGHIVSAWRQGSPKSEDCCWRAAGKIPYCTFALKRASRTI